MKFLIKTLLITSLYIVTHFHNNGVTIYHAEKFKVSGMKLGPLIELKLTNGKRVFISGTVKIKPVDQKSLFRDWLEKFGG